MPSTTVYSIIASDIAPYNMQTVMPIKYWLEQNLIYFTRACNRYRLDVCLSVCPSVRLSVTRWYCIKTAEHIVMISSPHDSLFILVLCVPRSSRNSDGPYGGAKYRWGIKIARFSTNKSLYLVNDTRYRHGCYGRRIGTHTRSIKWCHFQWPWTNPNPVFKVTPLFDAKYLTNGYRYDHS